jgi:osmotically inducible protein OsmC
MPIRNATAVWHGNLFEGKGDMKFGGGAFEGQSRFEEGTGTNPEELIGAAHAGCFSMAFSATLANNGFKPEMVQTKSNVHLDKVGDGFTITTIVLNMEAQVPDIDDDKFQSLAEWPRMPGKTARCRERWQVWR